MFRRGVAPGGFSDWTYHIVAGPGGLWFNTNSDGVARIDVHGVVVHFRRGLIGNLGLNLALGPGRADPGGRSRPRGDPDHSPGR